MEGAGRIYRRQNRKIAAAIALPIVFLANTDSIGLLSRLREDRDLRAAAATAAAEWAAEPLARDESGATDLSEVCDRITEVEDGEDVEATDTTATTEPADATTTEPDPVEEARRRYKCAGDLFASSDLIGPVGPGPLWDEIRQSNDSDFVFNDLWSFTFGGSGFVGRLLTWAALLFGASFWYDVLRRLVGLKGKPAPSAERS